MKKQVSFVLFLIWFSMTYFLNKNTCQNMQFILVEGTP